MGMPTEYDRDCEECGCFGGSQVTFCEDCVVKVIDKWCDESDKLFEQSDIKRLKKMFGIVLKGESHE